MHRKIKAVVKCRVATAPAGAEIVCGNTGYTVTFTFDEEWAEHPDKTARFKFLTPEGPQHYDQEFTGDTVEVPPLANTREVEVGVFVGSLATTTGAFIRCRPSIRCGSSTRSADVALGVVDAILDEAGVEGDTTEEKAQELVDASASMEAEVKDLSDQVEELEAENAELQASIKPEQEKTVDITENGTTEIMPDGDKTLSRVAVNVNVPTSDGTEELEAIIDESGLEIEGETVTEKVEQLIDKSEQAILWRDNLASYNFTGYKGTVLPEINLETLNTMKGFKGFCLGTYAESIDFYINGNNPTTFEQAFYGTTYLKRIKGCNTSNATSLRWMFHQSGIEEIEMPFDLSKAADVTNAFTTALSLKKIGFVKNTIPISISFNSKDLTVESAISIILGLKNYSTDDINMYTHALKLPDEVWAKLDAAGNVPYEFLPEGYPATSWYEYVIGYVCWNT